MSESQLPIQWEEELAKSAKEVALTERPAISQISTRSGMLSYQKQPVPGNKLDVIVIATAYENKYFAGRAFDPNNYQAPVCYALSLLDEDMVPHEDSSDQQSTSCATCEQFKWGSQGPGKKGKACKSARRLALIPADVIKSGNIGSSELAVLSIPTTSQKNWANYVNSVAGEYQRPPWGIITEVRAEPDARTQFQIRFAFKGLIDNEYLGAIHRRIPMAQDVLLTPYDASGTVAGAPDPAPLGNRKY
jgi:hypothetical protein